MALGTQIKKAWNAFLSEERRVATKTEPPNYGAGASYAPQRTRSYYTIDRSIVASIYNKIAVDVAGIPMRHVTLDDQGRYLQDTPSKLNECLKYEPNIDQGPRHFRQDMAASLMDNGVIAVVPVDTAENPEDATRFDILSLRVGIIKQWYPRHVRVAVYNDRTGKVEEVTLAKEIVAIVENPFYPVMNESNSTLQRLTRKLQLLDSVDEASNNGKLDLIIQLPYVVKSSTREEQALQRTRDIEMQLSGSTYGIAYIDGAENITQLNRPAENQLMAQVEYLTALLYNQLGITEQVMDGTADEKAMINYFNRTVKPILDALVEGLQRSLLRGGILRRNERIQYFRDPFALVPISEIATVADKFSRNEIMTANELRSFMGLPPSTDPKADKLENSNMPKSGETEPQQDDES